MSAVALLVSSAWISTGVADEGQGRPQGTAPEAGAAEGKGGQAAPGRSGLGGTVGRFYSTRDSSGAPAGEPAAEEPTVELPADGYVVKKGDTLWGLSATYLRDPLAWPQLWALNPGITNPHWIYPGDRLRLSAGVPMAAPPPVTAPPRGSSLLAQRRWDSDAIFIRQTAFVEPQELARAGKILASREEKTLLTTLDEAYVEYKRGEAPAPGARYSVYRLVREVKHPVTQQKLGDIVHVVGEIEVKAAKTDTTVRVVVTTSTDSMERGFLVGPLRPLERRVSLTPASQSADGLIVGNLIGTSLIGSEELVFVNLGRREGVELGNRYSVVRRGDGYQPLLARGPVDDTRFPRESVGEIVVIDVRDQVSVGVLTHAVVETRVGDRVELRSGH
jgi:LysM repeat protein